MLDFDHERAPTLSYVFPNYPPPLQASEVGLRQEAHIGRQEEEEEEEERLYRRYQRLACQRGQYWTPSRKVQEGSREAKDFNSYANGHSKERQL